MPTTYATTVTAPTAAVDVAATARDHARFGWTVAVTAQGPHLVTDAEVAGIELTDALAAGVRRYLRSNNLTGPVLEIRGPGRREIHLVTGASKARRAIEALREAGAIVHVDGAVIPLPSGGGDGPAWGVAPAEARWAPPLVAVAAAVRSAARRAKLLGATR
ncbi:hypothetical protein ACWEKT_05340 [Nocardia takedensis]